MLPPEIEISVPEGFAYYALDPELYRIAARRFRDDAHPERVAVIGIRSIGTTLGAIVAPELGGRLWTVRPHGHPWDRRIQVGVRRRAVVARVERPFRDRRRRSGAQRLLVRLAWRNFSPDLASPTTAIVFLPSWEPDVGALLSETARRRWRASSQVHRRISKSWASSKMPPISPAANGGGCAVFAPAVQPQHERRKYLRGDRLYKFAGYGRYGREKLARAERLAGWIPPVLGLERGFLVHALGRRPVRARDAGVHRARCANTWRTSAREFQTGDAADVASLAALIEENTGRAWPGRLPEGRAVALDGRMLPHEWLETPAGYVKTDALDHHDDHFFPGPQDIAWDVAAFDDRIRRRPVLPGALRARIGRPRRRRATPVLSGGISGVPARLLRYGGAGARELARRRTLPPRARPV